MDIADFYEEARRLEEQAKHISLSTVTRADHFDIRIVVEDSLAGERLHECGNDEFLYVLKGKAEAQVDDKVIPLEEGQGILVKAGEKHKFMPSDRIWRLVISKQPHEHLYYEPPSVLEDSL